MASNNGGRKRQQKSKTGLQHKVSQSDKQRDHSSQQPRQQLNETQNKHPHDHHGQQHQTQQQQQQKQQQQQQKQKQQQQLQQRKQQQQQQQRQLHSSTTTLTKTVLQSGVSETPIQSLMSKTVVVGRGDQDKFNVTLQDGNTSLHTAVCWRRHDIVEALLKKGAKPWETDQQGNTAFIAACRVGDTKLMLTIWDAAGSNLDIQHANKEGNTALHFCAVSGHEEGCHFLLSRNAGVQTKNKLGETPLHLAAKGDHVSVCHTLLNFIMLSARDTLDMHCCILEENGNEQSAICVSIMHQHAQVTRMLLDFLTAQQQATYLTSKIRKVVNQPQPVNYSNSESTDQGCQEVFLHGLLVSLSVLLIRLAERRRLEKSLSDQASASKNDVRLDHCLTSTDIIQLFVRIACNRHDNQQIIVPIACFLMIYLMEGVPERAVVRIAGNNLTSEMCFDNENISSGSSKILHTGMTFLGQFIQCRGPDNLLLKLKETDVTDPNNAMVTIATAAPIVSLVRSVAGRSWLESNKCHLTFLKELLLRNRSTLALLTSTCPLLHPSFLESICQEFVRLVEMLEDRDREKNLAELLWEEERDRMRRERKKQKRQQKKQQASKELKRDVSLLSMQMIEMSSEDETGMSLAEKMTAADDARTEMWKNIKPLQSEDDDVFGENSTSSKKYRIQDAATHGITCFLSRDELTLVRCEDESNKSQCDQKMKSNDFPSITTDKTAERIENTKMEKEDEKKGNGGTQMKEPMAYDNFQSECSGALPNVKRWADVAKLGCNTADRGLQGQEETDSQSRMSSDKVSFCDWPRTGSLKNDDMFKAVKDTGMANAQKQEVVDLNMIDTEWYDVINPCSAMDINSDEDSSSSSSSSYGSRSSLVSDSCLHIRKQNWLSEKVHIDVKLEDDEACKEKAADLSTCSPLLSRKKRRKSKTSQSCKQAKTFALYATDTCWDPSCHLSKDQSSMPLLTEEDKIKVTFKRPGVGAPLLRTQSDDVLNDSSSSEDVKKSYGLKADSTFKTSIKNNPLWNQMTASTFKTETPTALPPLKVREIDINRAGVGDSFLVDSGAVESKGETKGESTEMRKFVRNTTCGKQSFRGRNTPLARIKTGASLFNAHRADANAHSYGNVQDASSSRNNIIPWSDLSTLIVPTSALPQRSLSISPLPGQDVLYTHPPPPGFQTLKSTMSGQAITDTQGCHKTIASDIKNHEIRHRMAAATSTKGRVITTILLDKVKNPPISFKQNKVPSLSTLAWHCGEESNQVWSKLLHSKITTTVPASVFESDTVRSTLRSPRGDYVLDTPFSKPSSEITTLSIPSEHDRAGQYGIVRPSNLCLPFPCSSIPVFSSFSTILMNRMQQRRHNRNSSSSLNMAGDVTSNKSNHGAEVCTKEQTSRPSRTAPGASVTLDTSSLSSVQPRNHPSISQQHTHIQQLRQHQLSSKPTILVESHQSDAVEMVKIPNGSLTAVTREIGNRNTEGRYTVSNSQCQENQRRSCHHSDSRGTSPPVFFPEQIRDDVNTTAERGATFPAFHDVHTSDFLSEMFSDPLFSDKIAINQIRQKILSSQTNQSQQSEFSVQATEGSDIDLDYYASLYQMKFRDVLGCLPGQNMSSSKSERETNLIGGQKAGTNATPKDGQGWNKNNQLFGVSPLPGNRGDVRLSRTHSPRWHTSLQKMLDLPWTMRRQYGNIVLPHCVPDFSIGMSGDVLLLLGFLIDGNEVAVLIMDKARSHILPRMVEVISDSEMDKHFLTRCKSFSESSNIQYMAIALYEYTLCEYLQLCLPAGNQNQSISTGLIWELLQALSFLHHGLGMPHGYLAPCWIFIDAEGHLRLAGFGITTTSPVVEDKNECNTTTNFQGYEYISPCMTTTDDLNNERAKPSFCNDTQAAGMLAYFILTKGQHLFGVASLETELNLMRERVGTEAFDFISPMLASDPKSRPTIDQCLKHPMFWSGDKKFRLILIVGSDVLTEMKTGVALTGNGAPTMMEILSSEDINAVSPNWIHEVDGTVLKEMRSFRVYKNNLAELTLFVYNCCLHFDKLSNVAKEVLDDPCKYFQTLFPGLFIAIYRSLKSSDRTDRTCYKPFF